MRTLSRHRLIAFALAAFTAFGLVQAQSVGSALQVEPRPSALDCLHPRQDQQLPLPYPPGAVERKAGAVVRVRLVFSDAASAPTAEFFYNSGSGAFEDAVRRHVAAYRLPCMAKGAPAIVASQEFQFVPGDGRQVIWNEPRNGVEDAAVAACLRGGSPDRPLHYPQAAAQNGDQGTVVVRLTFAEADKAPTVETVFDGGSPILERTVRRYVDGYRLPCLTADTAPLTALQQFAFSFKGEQVFLKDVTLRQFVAAVDDLDKHRVRFDFSTMACPFDVKLRLFQPYMRNDVGEVGSSDPNRREFVEWLRDVALKLPKKARQQAIGDSLTIAVPCGVLDLL